MGPTMQLKCLWMRILTSGLLACWGVLTPADAAAEFSACEDEAGSLCRLQDALSQKEWEAAWELLIASRRLAKVWADAAAKGVSHAQA